MDFIIALVIGVVIAFIIVSVMKSDLKTVQSQHSASCYEKAGTFKLSVNEDRFLYKHLEKKEKEVKK